MLAKAQPCPPAMVTVVYREHLLLRVAAVIVLLRDDFHLAYPSATPSSYSKILTVIPLRPASILVLSWKTSHATAHSQHHRHNQRLVDSLPRSSTNHDLADFDCVS